MILTFAFYRELLLLTAKIMPDLDSTYPKTPMSNFTDSLIFNEHIYITNFEMSPT